MRTARMRRVAAAKMLYVNLGSAPGGAYMSGIAESAHRRNRILRQWQARYEGLLASLNGEQYAPEAKLLVLPSPLRTVVFGQSGPQIPCHLSCQL